MNINELKLWTALVTPMQADGSVDFVSLENIVRRQEAAGNGILLLGSTGEGLALDQEEKKSVVSFVSRMNPDVAVMAGVGGFNLKMQQQWIETCNHLNINAFLLVAPLYSKPRPVGMESWFRSLLDVSGKPCMLYNIPGRTGVKIPPSVNTGTVRPSQYVEHQGSQRKQNRL
jgi:4-hydroxy-tetrahydrodipicolinate synthase